MSREKKPDRRRQQKEEKWRPLYSVGDRVIVKGSFEVPGKKQGTIKRIDKDIELYFIKIDGGIVGLPFLESQILEKVNGQY